MEPFRLLSAGRDVSQHEKIGETTSAAHAANKHLVRRFIDEVFNAGNIAILDELVADDHIDHGPLGNHCGLESIRRDLLGYRAAFPDLNFEIVELVAEGDRVARRYFATGTHLGAFMGAPPTGRRITLAGLAIDRIVAGKLVETWNNVDLFGLLGQVCEGAPPMGH